MFKGGGLELEGTSLNEEFKDTAVELLDEILKDNVLG